MEASDYFHGGCNRLGTPKFTVEKQGKCGGDNFIVEDLLDLSNEEDNASGMIIGVGSGAAVGFSSTDSSSVTAVDSCSNCVSGGPDSHFSGELDCRCLTDAGLSGDM